VPVDSTFLFPAVQLLFLCVGNIENGWSIVKCISWLHFVIVVENPGALPSHW